MYKTYDLFIRSGSEWSFHEIQSEREVVQRLLEACPTDYRIYPSGSKKVLTVGEIKEETL